MTVIIPADILQIIRHLRGADAGIVRHQHRVGAQLLADIREAWIIILEAPIEEEEIDGSEDAPDFLASIAHVLSNEIIQAGAFEILPRLGRPIGIKLKSNQPDLD